MIKAIEVIKGEYQALVNQLADLDHQLGNIEAQETAKKAQLGERKAELANRIRDAYEAERTSMLETFLSGASFTDMLARMSTQLDAAEQDKALAAQIAEDRETLLALHVTVEADAGADQHAAPGDGGPEAEARPAARRAQEGAGEAQEAREGREGGARRAAAPLQAARRGQEGPPARARRDRRGQAQARQADRPARRAPVQHGQHPVQVQRDAALADAGLGLRAVRLHRRTPSTRRATAASTSTTGSTSSRRTARRSAPRRRAASCTSAGTTPTAPTRPGS